MIGALAGQTLRRHYAGTATWLALAAVQLLLAWMLFAQLEVYLKIQPRLATLASPMGINDLVVAPTLASAALALLLLAPLLGMGSIAGERRSGRLALLLSSPLSPGALVLGRWLGLLLALLPAVALPLLMALVLGLGSHLDGGRLAASALGLLLVAALAGAVTLWFSSLAGQPLAAAALSWGLLFLLWFLDSSGGQGLAVLSLRGHFEPFLQGRVTLGALTWFATLTAVPLVLAVHRIWRMQGGD